MSRVNQPAEAIEHAQLLFMREGDHLLDAQSRAD